MSIEVCPNISYGCLKVQYTLKKSGDAAIEIYDVSGVKRKSIKIVNCLPGYYQKTLNLTELASGVYFVVLKHNGNQVSKKFLLIR